MYDNTTKCIVIRNHPNHKSQKEFCMTIEKNLDRNKKPDLKVLYDNRKK